MDGRHLRSTPIGMTLMSNYPLIPLEVTQSDIDTALDCSRAGFTLSLSCAVVQAYKRTFPKDTSVSCGITHLYSFRRRWWWFTDQFKSFELSSELVKVTRAWPKSLPARGYLTPQ